MKVKIYDCKLMANKSYKGCVSALKRCLAADTGMGFDLSFMLSSPLHQMAIDRFYGIHSVYWVVTLLREEER